MEENIRQPLDTVETMQVFSAASVSRCYNKSIQHGRLRTEAPLLV